MIYYYTYLANFWFYFMWSLAKCKYCQQHFPLCNVKHASRRWLLSTLEVVDVPFVCYTPSFVCMLVDLDLEPDETKTNLNVGTLQSKKGFCCFFQFTQSLMHSLTEDFAHLPPSHQDSWQDLHKSHHTWIAQCSHNVYCDHPMITVHIQLCWMCTVSMTLCLWFKKRFGSCSQHSFFLGEYRESSNFRLQSVAWFDTDQKE